MWLFQWVGLNIKEINKRGFTVCLFLTGSHFCIYLLQNIEKKHRTNLYAFIVTDLLDEWEDGKVMGKHFLEFFSCWLLSE